MKAFLYFILFISIDTYSQTNSIDTYKKQIKLDSVELIRTQLRIRSLEKELDSLKSESENIQILIDQLKHENILLEQLMKRYLQQINPQPEKSSGK
jgi:hypothetical protein